MKLLTIAEAAAVLSASKSLVYELLDQGEIPYVPVGKSKAYRIDAEDLATFIQRRKVQNEGRKPKAPRPRLKHIKV